MTAYNLLAVTLGSLMTVLAAAAVAVAPVDDGVCSLSAAPAESGSTRRVPTIRESVYRTLAGVDAAMQENRPAEARRLLEDALARTSLNDNETGQLLNLMAALDVSAGDYAAAIAHLERVAALGHRYPGGLALGTLHSLAQLYFVTERYGAARGCLRAWLARTEDAGAAPLVFMAQIHYRLNDSAAAIEPLERAIDLARRAGQPVKEDWWQLALHLYVELERWPAATRVLETLVRDFPKREYWLQLAAAYGHQGLDEAQVHAMEAAHAGDYLSVPGDHLTYARLLLQAEVPYRAAFYLDQTMAAGKVPASIDNLRTLSQAWFLSREVDAAIEALEAAASATDDPELLLRLARFYLDDDRFTECSRVASRARPQRPENIVDVHMVRGMCLYHQHRFGPARSAFEAARRQAADPSAERRLARQWLGHIDMEQARLLRLSR